MNIRSGLTIFANILVVMVVLYLIVRVVPLPMQVVTEGIYLTMDLNEQSMRQLNLVFI